MSTMQTELRFDGKTYDPALDKVRLGNQVFAVLSLMLDGRWRTLTEMEFALELKYPQASISARLRDLRKPRFGGYTVNRRRRDNGMRGIHEYQVIAT